MMASPIQDTAARYRATRAKILADAAQAAEAIRRDYGQPRDRRKWQDHALLWNNLRTDAQARLNRARQETLDALAAAKQETRRALFRVPVDTAAGVNHTLAQLNYRAAREQALALPFGEVGLNMAMERMELAILTSDEPAMAALSLVAEQRDRDGRTAWARIPRMWEQASGNRFTRERLAELAEVEVAMRQLADPERFDMGRLTPLTPEPEPPPTLEPAPSLAGSDGQTGGGGGEPPAMG
jgi:hypothetical protein